MPTPAQATGTLYPVLLTEMKGGWPSSPVFCYRVEAQTAQVSQGPHVNVHFHEEDFPGLLTHSGLSLLSSHGSPKAFFPSGTHYGLQHLLCLEIIIMLFSFYVSKMLTFGDVCLISQPPSPPLPGTEQPPLARVLSEVIDPILVART